MKTKMKLMILASRSFYMVPVIVLAMIAFSSCGKNQFPDSKKTELPPPPPPVPGKESDRDKKIDGAYQVVDEMPVFPGGDSLLLKYIAQNTTYPREAKEKGIQGRVIVRFMVKADGKVSDVSVLKSDNAILDAESVRVVNTLPDFLPGKLKGETVPVWFMVPITYALK